MLFIVVAEEEEKVKKKTGLGKLFFAAAPSGTNGSPLFKRPFLISIGVGGKNERERDETLGPGQTKKGFLHSIESIAESKWNGLFSFAISFYSKMLCTRSWSKYDDSSIFVRLHLAQSIRQRPRWQVSSIQQLPFSHIHAVVPRISNNIRWKKTVKRRLERRIANTPTVMDYSPFSRPSSSPIM